MIKFIKKVLLILSLITITFIGIFFIDTGEDESYIISAIDKVNKLKTLEGQKLLLVGGSNIPYSIDTQKLSESLGIKAYDMGVNSGFGIKYMINQIKPYIEEGDIVVISPEYDHFFDGYADGGIALLNLLDSDISMLEYISFENIAALKKMPMFAKYKVLKGFSQLKNGKPSKDWLFNRYVFNEYGDVIVHRNKKPIHDSNKYLPLAASKYDEKTIEYMNQFYEYAKKKGVTVYLTFPPYPEKQFRASEKYIKLLYEEVKKAARFPVISYPENYIFGNEYYFDEVYHLTSDKIDDRTDKLIKDIQNQTSLP